MTRYNAIYTRQSIDKKDSLSIENQIELCKAMGGNDAKVYSDRGFSGKNTERPGLKSLMKDIERGLVKTVYVYKLDRISRNIGDFYKLYEFMQAHECMFVSISENFDTTSSMGRAMMGILAVFAQMERENIQKRVKDNYDYRIKDHRWASGPAPYGFRNGKLDGKATLIPVEEELALVKMIFKEYATRPTVSIGMLMDEINKNGGKGRQSEKGISRATIRRILQNPIYAQADNVLANYYEKKRIAFANDLNEWNGMYSAGIVGKNNRSLRADDLTGIIVYITNIKWVIDSRTFIMVQDRLEQNQAVSSDNTPNNKMKELSGLLKCGECGKAVKIRCYPTLTCSGRDQDKTCNASYAGIRLENIRKAVDNKVIEYLGGLNETVEQKRKRKKQTERKIEELQKKLDNAIELALISDDVADTVKSKINDLTIQIKDLQLKLSTDNAQDIIELRLGLQKTSEFSSLFDDDGFLVLDYTKLDDARKQTILKVLVKRILLYKDGTIKVEWNN